ncbi:MAG: DNA repair protein RecN [Phycisphaeraceae bacterium]|nr:DNA repair protein RecN [Phycisphaeraceae bacterium]
MLRELSIQNLAVIQATSIEFGPGLNVFTGQTGAGKSLILGAIQSLLGMKKSAAKMIRPGTEQARISGVFDVLNAESAEQAGLALDLDLLPGDELVLTRKIFATGRSSLSANGQPVTAAMAKLAAETLIDIHGQHDHQSLMRPMRQLTLLDDDAGCANLRRQFTEQHKAWADLCQAREDLNASAELREQQLDLYRFQLGEIDGVEPLAGEMPELTARERVLNSLSKIKEDTGTVYSALYDSEGSIAERLQAMTHVLLGLADIDEQLEPVAEQVRTATLTLQESAFELSRYTDRLEMDPAELAEVQGRLNALNRLIQKYGDGRSTAGLDDPLTPVLDHREHLADQIKDLEGQSTRQDSLDEKITAYENEMAKLGQKLTAKRTNAAGQLGPKIMRQLKELGMAEATLSVRVESNPIEHAASAGLDRVDFLARTNPGQDERPLREIASGGELSRVMLAIKSVLSSKKSTKTSGAGVDVLVFDEIDANIGGRLGDVIGRKLRELAASKNSDKQVLCITHLPQIAAFADQHFHIIKEVTGTGKAKRTDTTVQTLTGKDRINELAEMLAGNGATATSRRQAKELISAAA